MNDPAKAISELYQMNKAEVAQKSLFFSKAHLNDPITHQLLQETADELIEMIRLLLNRMNQTQVKLALAGSVLEKITLFENRLLLVSKIKLRKWF
ncbi:hypothetical protein ODV97_11440 [Enterococcus gallinarum]|nr:hypothetical protein [Enterococcus gallinarum]